MPQAASLVYFLIGMCHSELGKPTAALDAFNNAIKVNPEYAEVALNFINVFYCYFHVYFEQCPHG